MGAAFWIKRYLLAAVPLFAILAGVEWYKGSTAREDFISAGVWALAAAAIFTVSNYRKQRMLARARACSMCDDIGARSKAKAAPARPAK